jgi:hypothetical protein
MGVERALQDLADQVLWQRENLRVGRKARGR